MKEMSKIPLAHVMVVSLSLALTWAAWAFSKDQIDTRVEQRFEIARDHVVSLIRDRMLKYEDALWNGVATIESHGGEMSYAQWLVFAETLNIQEKYPGINGIGVINYHTPATFDAFMAEQRLVRPEFEVYPPHDQPYLMPITFIVPEDINAAAIGLDIAHEENRRTAALASRDTGVAQITGPIVLVQDADSTPGFLFYAPLYATPGRPQATERAAQFQGAVYAPFVMHKLMEGLLAKERRSIRLSIHDGETALYDEHQKVDADTDPDPMFSDTVVIEIYGRTWRLDMRTNLAFRAVNVYLQPTVILVAGLIVEALIIALLYLMARINVRAVSYANKVTAELDQEKEKLSDLNALLEIKNKDIEQFAYLASHDLKTPIRGIGGLTEMIEEDLQEYFQSSNANPDVSLNLNHIHNRVRHMNDLTSGILQFSKVIPDPQHQETLVLKDTISALRNDLDLTPEQLQLSGPVETVAKDAHNFRRVLENLVGNAIKYHDHKHPLRIHVASQPKGSKYQFKVIDNGPGIEAKNHAKVFDIFQTLGLADHPESTGIGLAIVKRAIVNNGGEITLTSSLGKGATFTFTWPGNCFVDTENNAA